MTGDDLDTALADGELADWIRLLRSDPAPSARELGVAALREASRARWASRPQGPQLTEVVDRTLELDRPLPVRLYRPSPGAVPVVVFAHGGGWTVGDLDSHDRVCRLLAARTGCLVLAVDYRRAPEHPWPAAADDVTGAVGWAVEHAAALGGSGVVGVAGDSAGGHLAALACHRLRDRGAALPAAQLLLYPNTDLTLTRPSVRAKARGWGLDAEQAAWFAEQWVPDPDLRADPAVSPLHADDLTGLPPAVIVTAEHDVLRDEGDAYAGRLAEAGVPVVHRCEPGLVHGFASLDLVSPAAAAAADRAYDDLRRLLDVAAG